MGLINLPNTFSADETIVASEVNDNFSTIANEFNGSIEAANIAANAVSTAKIADSAVTADKLGSSAVTTAKINNGAVTNAKLDTGAGGIGAAWQSWTPTFTNWTIGTGGSAGTTGAYLQIGKLVFWRLYSVLGTSGASVGGAVDFTLPVNASSGVTGATSMQLGHGHGNAGGSFRFNLDVTYTATQKGLVEAYTTNSGSNSTKSRLSALSSTDPATWAAGNYISLSGMYETA